MVKQHPTPVSQHQPFAGRGIVSLKMYTTLYTALTRTYTVLSAFSARGLKPAMFPAVTAAAKKPRFSKLFVWAASARMMRLLVRSTMEVSSRTTSEKVPRCYITIATSGFSRMSCSQMALKIVISGEGPITTRYPAIVNWTRDFSMDSRLVPL